MKHVHQFSVKLTRAQYRQLDDLNEDFVEAGDSGDKDAEERLAAQLRNTAAEIVEAAGFLLLESHSWTFTSVSRFEARLDVTLPT